MKNIVENILESEVSSLKKTNNVEKYIYKFLVQFNSNDFYTAFNYLCNKYRLEENYVASIVQECVKSNYLDGIVASNSLNNHKCIDLKEHRYVTREGYKFIHLYRLAIFNFFWIPFKNLVIIIVTAIITAFATYLFKN